MDLYKADVIISGWNGKMGRTLRSLVPNYFSGHLHDGLYLNVRPKTPLVWIDFSHASCFNTVIDAVRMLNCPIVMGTTGLAEKDLQQLKILSQQVPVFYDTNFSVGIHILRNLFKSIFYLFCR